MSGNGRRPAVVVDPARKLGEPHLDGTRVTVAQVIHAVWDKGLTASQAATNLGLDVRQIIVACWYRATTATSDHQRQVWRRRWGAWAAAAAPLLDAEQYHRVPDPPSPARPNDQRDPS